MIFVLVQHGSTTQPSAAPGAASSCEGMGSTRARLGQEVKAPAR